MTTKQLGFSLDISRCSGCMACTVACFDQNDLPGNQAAFRHVSKIESGKYPDSSIAYFSLSCMHCGDAPCVAVCPSGALKKEDNNGIVLVNRELCIGCHACAVICPFGAPQFPEGKTMAKCDACISRVNQGMEPACVRTCTTKALAFGPIEQLTEERSKSISTKIVMAFNPHLGITKGI
jgi:anaerobic dimethyl sulfoxide reductase subunit B (iron-sulfur subunit)